MSLSHILAASLFVLTKRIRPIEEYVMLSSLDFDSQVKIRSSVFTLYPGNPWQPTCLGRFWSQSLLTFKFFLSGRSHRSFNSTTRKVDLGAHKQNVGPRHFEQHPQFRQRSSWRSSSIALKRLLSRKRARWSFRFISSHSKSKSQYLISSKLLD